MNIIRGGATATKRGPEAYFTGTVWIDDIAATTPVRIARVTFEPGARTAWHTHPHGQTIHILAGLARVQKAGEAVIEVRAGDSVWFEPGERHWHGAGPATMMTHLAVQQADAAGNAAAWQEHVSDADYGIVAAS